MIENASKKRVVQPTVILERLLANLGDLRKMEGLLTVVLRPPTLLAKLRMTIIQLSPCIIIKTRIFYFSHKNT